MKAENLQEALELEAKMRRAFCELLFTERALQRLGLSSAADHVAVSLQHASFALTAIGAAVEHELPEPKEQQP